MRATQRSEETVKRIQLSLTGETSMVCCWTVGASEEALQLYSLGS